MISNAFIFLHFLWIRAIFGSNSMKFRRFVQSVTGTWPKAFRTRKSILFAKCYRDVVKTRIFMHFQRVLIEDFRGFWLISRFSTVFEHRFERFQVAQCFQKRSLSCIFHASDEFSAQNPWNFDAWCKALPERDQKRSGCENHAFLQSVTWTCSKRDFS